jgi:pyridoxal phosphate enzyme (YggS family)
MTFASYPPLAAVLQRIAVAARAAGRDPATIALIAVSKTFDAGAIAPVLAAGQLRFGENRVQESQAKWPLLRASHAGIELHLIGPLQSNKVAPAVALFDAIHTVDRLSLAKALAREMEKQKRSPTLMVQVNTGAEPQKAGVLPEAADRLIAECRDTLGLTISGLMCIPPVDVPPEPHFSLLAEIAQRNGVTSLSMGMSHDFEAAIACGATHIRVGSAIFGTR